MCLRLFLLNFQKSIDYITTIHLNILINHQRRRRFCEHKTGGRACRDFKTEYSILRKRRFINTLSRETKLLQGLFGRRCCAFEDDKNGLSYDEVEWINESGSRRQELRDQDVEVPTGIYIYNEAEINEEAVFSEDCEFLAVDGMNHDKLICLSKEQMVRRIKWERREKIVYYLVIEDGQIIRLQEQYVTKH